MNSQWAERLEREKEISKYFTPRGATMKPNDKTPIDIIANLEQMEGSMVNLAPIVASYYKALKENGIPDEMAEQLTTHWHSLYWTSILNAASRQ